MGNQKKAKGAAGTKAAASSNNNGDLLWVDPARIRFAHARIRPFFSGCGRSVHETLESMRQEKMAVADLPPIQVIMGPETEDGDRWYFSLNNRRLWVYKRCREEGLLRATNNQIAVRVRAPKSVAEQNRYTLEKCALEAKLMREGPSHNAAESATKTEASKDTPSLVATKTTVVEKTKDLGTLVDSLQSTTLATDSLDVSSSDDDSSTEPMTGSRKNPFSLLE